MGSNLSSASGLDNAGRGTKRIPEDQSDPDGPASPKRRRTKATSKYIYETLFLNGEGSDVTIKALGHEWNLHKVYLKQCAYFSSMFRGSWMETDASHIFIDVPDPLITIEALSTTFASLYKDEIFIKPPEVISVLAAATLFQLDELINTCGTIMKDTLQSCNVCAFYTSATTYGLPDVSDLSFNWLLQNLLSNHTADLLREISVELMTKLIRSPDLCVIQVETDVYTMLKKWMFVKLEASWLGNDDELEISSNRYFDDLKKNSRLCVLETASGRPFVPAFQALRWHYVVNDAKSLRLIRLDDIVPKKWLLPVFEFQWHHMLNSDCFSDVGPQDVTKDMFEDYCFRCGRILPSDDKYCWRWMGYGYGLDLIVTYSNRLVTLKRNTLSQEVPAFVSLQLKRVIAFRLTLTSLDGSGKCMRTKTTGIKEVILFKDQESTILMLDDEFTFPLTLSFNVLHFKPTIDDGDVGSYLDVPPADAPIRVSEIGVQTSVSSLGTPRTLAPRLTTESSSEDDDDDDSADCVERLRSTNVGLCKENTRAGILVLSNICDPVIPTDTSAGDSHHPLESNPVTSPLSVSTSHDLPRLTSDSSSSVVDIYRGSSED